MRNSAEANKDSKQMNRFFSEYGSHLKFFQKKVGMGLRESSLDFNRKNFIKI